ncbi:hypothetical protein CRENBAI_013445 [Crenichthys baileyi]|uniref:Uncharacterized protein n=1 Tax=Crenichthys baileyi TaxID=28760 RepID=A0AAV9SIW1_9TELE
MDGGERGETGERGRKTVRSTGGRGQGRHHAGYCRRIRQGSKNPPDTSFSTTPLPPPVPSVSVGRSVSEHPGAPLYGSCLVTSLRSFSLSLLLQHG